MRILNVPAIFTIRAAGIFALALLLLSTRMAQAQTHWANTYGGPGNDAANSVEQASDGGYIVLSNSDSFGPERPWVLKLAADGSIQWQNLYGGNSGFDGLQSIQQTVDGGYVAAGITQSFGAGSGDVWVLKLASDGSIQWSKTFGGTGYDTAFSIRQTTDTGYVVAGYTSSFGAGQQDIWVLKLDSTGAVQWQRAYGTSGFDSATCIRQTLDSGYIVAAATNSFGSGVWILKLSSTGDIQWQRIFGGLVVNEIQQTTDGGYIFASSIAGSGGHDSWLVKLNVDGAIEWQEYFNDPGDDQMTSVQQTSDGGYIAGASTFISGDLKSRMYKLASNGTLQWQKIIGEPGDLYILNSVREASDGGFIAAVETESFGTNGPDALIMKTDSTGTVETFCSYIHDDVIQFLATSAIPVDTNALVNVTNATVSSGGAASATAVTPVGHCLNPACLYCYAFDQNPLPPSDWTYVKPAWTMNSGNLQGTPVGKKASALAIPAFGGCSRCSVRTSMSTAGGSQNKIWLMAWFTDKKNMVEVLMKQENNKFVLRQRANGVIVGKTKGIATIIPNQFYDVKVVFDGAAFTLIVDGNTLATLPAAATPTGTVGFQVKGTTGAFRFVYVEQ